MTNLNLKQDDRTDVVDPDVPEALPVVREVSHEPGHEVRGPVLTDQDVAQEQPGKPARGVQGGRAGDVARACVVGDRGQVEGGEGKEEDNERVGLQD